MDENQLVCLKKHYMDGLLSIFCGAGVAVDAGLPDWPSLLSCVLHDVFQRQEIVRGRSRVSHYFAVSFEQVIKKSPLIVAQYLKNELKDEWNVHVRNAWYRSWNVGSSEVMKAVGELCKTIQGEPKIKSILTYNFDDLIESEFDKEGIKYVSV